MTAALAAPRRRRTPVRPARILLHAVLITVVVAWITPIVGLLVYSLRTSADNALTGWWTIVTRPRVTSLNFSEAFDSAGLGQSLVNSLSITVPTTVFTVAVSAIGAYALARMEFRGRVAILMTAVALLVVPPQLTLVPLLRLFTQLGLTGEIWGIWIYQVGFVVPFGIYLLYAFFRAFPAELIEAAWLDGAGTITVFLRIVLPTSVPILVSLAIMQFMWSWNDLLIPLLFLGASNPAAPSTVEVAGLVQATGGGLNIVSAGALLSMVIPVVVALGLQRYFIRGLLGGAVKG
ncbi:carbohydrate ABC transporter permease [Rathayibacter sp. VKM Ac-2754]|uniref:carbohydrate ABC transporter permease n=1 Tax=Rathayibacter sp. VKM Ac-2754 TaxID=2609251 RepID=UPI0013578C3B|nr:carbohydrate ABC transporter permease [Rathayibacter sp. VKM Ac-2754]MWV60122.1 ABC transporter permease subunit [Rathayibacter sp. VKM Ac-2754]